MITYAIAFLGLVVILEFMNTARLRRRFDVTNSRLANAESLLAETERNYDALLYRTNELAIAEGQAKQLTHRVNLYVAGLKDQLHEMLVTYRAMQHGLEDIANYRAVDDRWGDTNDPKLVQANVTIAELKDIATKALPCVTLKGAMDVVATAIVDRNPSGKDYDEEAQQLAAAGGVAADQRNVKVDLTGQAERVRACLGKGRVIDTEPNVVKMPSGLTIVKMPSGLTIVAKE